MNTSDKLKRRFLTALLAMTVTLFAVLTATFAWYIYNTGAHTTKVHMAAGTNTSLEISNTYETGYSSSARLESFVGTLNPVSTNSIAGGFQKVFGFTNGEENQPKLVASLFGPGDTSDYYKTTLYIRAKGSSLDVYLSGITYEDSDSKNPISTAIRVGFQIHQPGKDKPVANEYIFEISDKKNPEAEYNTATGQQGYVLDSAKTDGTTLPFSPYTSSAFCDYNSKTGVVTIKDGSLKLFTVGGAKDGGAGTPVQVDIYIWLEGCDADCTRNLCSMTLRNLALSFAGYEGA